MVSSIAGRGHQISTTFAPSTAWLISILCKVNFLRLVLDNGTQKS